ncbi:protein NKG7-like [Caretta caretta]|uniref:protein NKG7-like n=1 Tax=Caretta caretta TaxID=8467 RepID=UPI002094A45D|nr:protein NKG7-like [Caretta caretta]
MASLRIPSTALALLSLLLLLAALGSDRWLVADGHLVTSYSGLWKVCVNSGCWTFASVPGYIESTRAFLFLAMIAGFLSFFALLASFFRSHLGSMSLTLISAVGSFSAGLCAMIALAVYTGEFAGAVNVAPGQVTFGWSFGLGWASFLLFLITGVVTLRILRVS